MELTAGQKYCAHLNYWIQIGEYFCNFGAYKQLPSSENVGERFFMVLKCLISGDSVGSEVLG